MDQGWKEKVWRQAMCDGAAQEVISRRSEWNEPCVPLTFEIDESVRDKFFSLCAALDYNPAEVLPQLVESFIRRLHLMHDDLGVMTQAQQEAFSMEVKQDAKIMQQVFDKREK